MGVGHRGISDGREDIDGREAAEGVDRFQCPSKSLMENITNSGTTAPKTEAQDYP